MSLRAQREFLWATRIQLLMLLTAAAGGVLTVKTGGAGTPVGAVVALVAFSIAVLVRVYTLGTRPESRWYEGRAAAESVKTLAWRYAVGGEPFRLDVSGCDELLVQRINELLANLERLESGAAGGGQITNEMRGLRSSPLGERKRAYDHDRIRDQQAWYREKASWNRRRALAWGLIVLAFQVAGAVAAIASVAQLVDIDLFGVAASASAAGTAWLQSRQHESLTTAYSVTSQELASIASLIAQKDDEASWASFVEDAEEAISREHTMWRASRGLRVEPAGIGPNPRD